MRDVFLSMDYFVVDIDLKGQDQHIQNVLEHIAGCIAEYFGTLRYNQSVCMHKSIARWNFSSPLTIFVPSWEAWTNNFLSNLITPPISAFLAGHLAVVITFTLILLTIRENLTEMVRRQNWRCFLGFAISLTLIPFLSKYFLFFNTAITEPSQWAYPLARHFHKNADWKLLVCSLNALTHCAPRSHPILMIREFSALESKSRTLFLKALESMKQGNVHFPVYIEASDFMWVADEPVIKSSDSFFSYYVVPMTYEEGFTELVQRYNIWTEAEYTTVYEAVGGHLGSLNTLYQAHKLQHFKLQAAIEHMDESAMRQLIASLDVTSNRSEAEAFLSQLSRSSNFLVEIKTASLAINTLLDRNILFRRGSKVYPQNRMMERAIASYEMKFGEYRPSPVNF